MTTCSSQEGHLPPAGDGPWPCPRCAGHFPGWACFHPSAAEKGEWPFPPGAHCTFTMPLSPQVRSQALLFIKRMYEKEQLREYVEKFALNYLQLLVHPNPPSVLFGADKDTGLVQVHQKCTEPCPAC